MWLKIRQSIVIGALVIAATAACAQTQYAEDPATLLNVEVDSGQADQIVDTFEEISIREGLRVDRGEFDQARHPIRAVRAEGTSFAVSLTNPHRAGEFILATYMKAGATAEDDASEEAFVREVSDILSRRWRARISPR